MKINPKTLTWLGASAREDGTPYLPSERKGYQISWHVKGTASPVLGLQLVDDSRSEVTFDFEPILAALVLDVVYEVKIREIAIEGGPSDWSESIDVMRRVAPPTPKSQPLPPMWILEGTV